MKDLVARLREALKHDKMTGYAAMRGSLLTEAADALEAAEARAEKWEQVARQYMRAYGLDDEEKPQSPDKDVAKIARDIYDERQKRITEVDIPARSADPDSAQPKGTWMDEYVRDILNAAEYVIDNAGLDTARGHADLRAALKRLDDRTSDDR
jgi:hypothetical protein